MSSPRFQSPPTPAERAFKKLREAVQQLEVGKSDPSEMPAWFVLTPAGAIRIKTIGVFSPFLKFVTPDGDQLLIAPEAISISIQQLRPESPEPRFKIGFARPEERGGLDDAGAEPEDEE